MCILRFEDFNVICDVDGMLYENKLVFVILSIVGESRLLRATVEMPESPLTVVSSLVYPFAFAFLAKKRNSCD